MNKLLLRALTIATSVALITGCSSSSPDVDDSVDQAGDESSAPESYEPPEKLQLSDDLTIECHDAESETFNYFSSIEEAWTSPRDEREGCGVMLDSWESTQNGPFTETYELTDKEIEAIETAGYSDEDSVTTLYGICAEADLGDLTEHLPWSSSQIEEAEGALVLCPDHPDRKTVAERMERGDEEEQARERGEIFADGDYIVGDDIQPGTYVAESDEPFDGCYWSRLDSAGNIIQNNFINSGFRVEVIISASDYSFSTERCGEWRKQ